MDAKLLETAQRRAAAITGQIAAQAQRVQRKIAGLDEEINGFEAQEEELKAWLNGKMREEGEENHGEFKGKREELVQVLLHKQDAAQARQNLETALARLTKPLRDVNAEQESGTGKTRNATGVAI